MGGNTAGMSTGAIAERDAAPAYVPRRRHGEPGKEAEGHEADRPPLQERHGYGHQQTRQKWDACACTTSGRALLLACLPAVSADGYWRHLQQRCAAVLRVAISSKPNPASMPCDVLPDADLGHDGVVDAVNAVLFVVLFVLYARRLFVCRLPRRREVRHLLRHCRPRGRKELTERGRMISWGARGHTDGRTTQRTK